MDETGGAVADSRRLPDAQGRLENLRERLGLNGEDDPFGASGLVEAAHRGRDVSIADRAHVAQFLGDDEVGIALLQHRVVEEIQTASAMCGGRDVSIDVPTG